MGEFGPSYLMKRTPAGGRSHDLTARRRWRRQCSREGNVAADLETEPQVGPLRRAGAPRIDGDHARPVAHALQQAVEEHRVRLARVGAPEQDEVGLLSEDR